LIPRKPKEILEKVVKENGFDESFTNDAVSFFWTELRKNLSEMAEPSITVSKLGIFTVKHWKIDEFVDAFKNGLDNADAMTWQQATYRKAMEKQHENFLRLKDKIESEFDRKNQKKKTREEYESAKTMGEQIQDNGGSPEQCDQEG
jgi:hypothetical protein